MRRAADVGVWHLADTAGQADNVWSGGIAEIPFGRHSPLLTRSGHSRFCTFVALQSARLRRQ